MKERNQSDRNICSGCGSMPIERVRTYIQGFDEIVNGGIPKRNVVLLSGGPGNGKSISGYQILYNGL